MIFHMSIAAQDPARVSRFFADIIGGEAFPFPPIARQSWIAISNDGEGTAIEVYPLGTVLEEVDGDADATGSYCGTDILTSTHGAIGTTLALDDVIARVRREGWSAKYRKRGNMFGVIEIWIEGRQMFEILTEDMQAEYRRAMKPAIWQEMLEAVPA